MMRTTRIRTISRADINALAYQGIMPSECYPQLRSTIERHFDEEHASLLAEPVFNAREGFIDWYVAFEGPVTCYASLDSAGQKEACERFRKLASDIVLYADELICSGDAQKVTRGHLLKLALRYPSDQDLFLVGDRVTATCWGYAPGTSGAQSAMLCDLRVREEAAQENVCV
ncbi:MAG: hypothetical protein J5803_01945, partial [Desulfovibrio sp.]|nr:hypothetical protein [Desulfovibrio sp.]